MPTDWPPIFTEVSAWSECPADATLEQRAAWSVLEVRDLNWSDFSPGDASVAADAEVLLREFRAVAPRVEADEEIAAFEGSEVWVEGLGYLSPGHAGQLHAALGAALLEVENDRP